MSPDPGLLSIPEIGAQFFLVLARLSFVVFFLPGIGEQMIPVRMRALILVALSACFVSLGLSSPVSDLTARGLWPLLAMEVLIGFTLGVSLRLAIWVMGIAGTIIAQSIGLAQFMGVGLETEAQTIFANMLSMAAAVLLLTMDYHMFALQVFVDIYDTVPLGKYDLLNAAFFSDTIFSAFRLGVTLAWPFVVVSLIYNISLGFINKAMPQLMVAFVGAPFMVGAGLFLLVVSVNKMLIALQDQLPDLMPLL